MAAVYCHPALRELKEQQSRYAPKERLLEQINRAETLHSEIEATRRYPYEYLLFRITGFRTESTSPQVLDGDGVRSDLRRLVEDLSAAVGQPVEQAAEPVLTVEQASRRYNVSTRTITRWRGQGLVARWFTVGGRPKVGFLESSLTRFVESAPRPGRPGNQVPEAHRRGTRGDHPPGPADGPDRPGRPDRDRPEDRQEDGTLDRDHPGHAQDLRPRTPRPRHLPPLDGPARRGHQGEDPPPVQPRARGLGGESGRPVRPDPVQRLPGPERDEGAPAPRGEAGVHAQPWLRRPGRPRGDARPDPRAGRRQGPAPDQGAQGAPALPGQPLRGPAPRSRAGGPPLPQDELPPGARQQAPRLDRPGQSPDLRPRRGRAGSATRPWPSRTRSSARTSVWSSRSPSATSDPRTTSSTWSRTAT